MPEKQIDSLIESGWRVLSGNGEESALHRWRENALECLSLAVGPDHRYTEHFAAQQGRPESTAILADVGVLTAARLWISQGCSHDAKSPSTSAQMR
ncbi:MAG: hypothetical protein V1792_28195 [Pseudomonadota bacterium]